MIKNRNSHFSFSLSETGFEAGWWHDATGIQDLSSVSVWEELGLTSLDYSGDVYIYICVCDGIEWRLIIVAGCLQMH